MKHTLTSLMKSFILLQCLMSEADSPSSSGRLINHWSVISQRRKKEGRKEGRTWVSENECLHTQVNMLSDSTLRTWHILIDGFAYNTRDWIFCELRRNTSNEQNVRAYYMQNHRLRDLLFHSKNISLFWLLFFLVRVLRYTRHYLSTRKSRVQMT